MDGIPYMICGSYRRGKPSCGDIEIVFIVDSGEVLGSLYTKLYKTFGYCLNGEPRMRGLWGEVQFDIFISKTQDLGFMLLHATGSGLHNELMRKEAKKYGLKLNQYNLSRRNGTVVLRSSNEEDIFKYLVMAYKRPEEREV